jgi:hypothetical protein
MLHAARFQSRQRPAVILCRTFREEHSPRPAPPNSGARPAVYAGGTAFTPGSGGQPYAVTPGSYAANSAQPNEWYGPMIPSRSASPRLVGGPPRYEEQQPLPIWSTCSDVIGASLRRWPTARAGEEGRPLGTKGERDELRNWRGQRAFPANGGTSERPRHPRRGLLHCSATIRVFW